MDQNLKVIAEFQDKASAGISALNQRLEEFAKGVREGAKVELDAFKQTGASLEGAKKSASGLGDSLKGIGGNLKGVVGDLNAIAAGSGDATDRAQGLVSALQNIGGAGLRAAAGALGALFSSIKTGGKEAEQAVSGVAQAAEASAGQIAATAGAGFLGFKGLKAGVEATQKALGDARKAAEDAVLDQIAQLAKLEAARKVYAELEEARQAKRLAAVRAQGLKADGTPYINLMRGSQASEENKVLKEASNQFYRQNIGAGKAGVQAAEEAVRMRAIGLAAAESDAALAAFGAKALPILGGIAAAAAAVGVAITAIAMSARDAADKNAELAEKLGVSTERLAALQVVASENSGTVEGLVAVYDKLSKSLNKGDLDNQKTIFAFESLGTSLEEINKLSKEEGAALLVKNFQDLGETTKATAAIAQLLGPGFRDQIPAIKAAAEGIDNATALVRKYGAEATPELVKAGGEQERALTEVGLAWKGFGNEVALATGTFVKTALDGLSSVLLGIKDFLKELRAAKAEAAATEAIPQARRTELLKQATKASDAAGDGTQGDINKRFKELLALEKQIGNQSELNSNFRRAEIADLNATAEAARKAALAKKSAAATLKEKDAKEKTDPFIAAKEDLLRQIALTKDSTLAEKTLFETQSGRYKDFLPKQKEELLNLARAIDLKNEQLKQEELLKAAQKNLQAENDAIALAEYELTLTGKTADERERLLLAKKEELRIAQLSKGLNQNGAEVIAAEGQQQAARKETIRLATEQNKTINALIDNSEASITASVQRNIGIAKQLLEESKISQADYVRYVQTQTKRITDLNKEAAEETSKYWEEAAKGIQGALEEFFFDAMQGNITNLLDSFKKMIDKMVAQALAAKLMSALFGDNLGKGQVGGFAATAGTFISGLFSGGKADGGSALAGRTYMTGEDGPELISLGTNAVVTPTKDLMAASRGDTFNFQVSTMDAKSMLQNLDGIKREFTTMVMDTRRTYNIA